MINIQSMLVVFNRVAVCICLAVTMGFNTTSTLFADETSVVHDFDQGQINPFPESAMQTKPMSFECLVEPWTVAEIGSHTRGVVAKVLVERGDLVQKGQPLLVLENRLESQNVELAEQRAQITSELAAREAERQLSKVEYQRILALSEKKHVSEQEKDKSQVHVYVAEASYLQAIENRRIKELELEHSVSKLKLKTIYSPSDGIVAQRYIDNGELAHNDPLLSLVELHPLRIEVVIPGEYFGQVRVGDQATLSLTTLPNSTFVAEVAVVDPVFDPHSGTFGVRFSLPNPDYSIPSGQRCQIEVALSSKNSQEPSWVRDRKAMRVSRKEPKIFSAKPEN